MYPFINTTCNTCNDSLPCTCQNTYKDICNDSCKEILLTTNFITYQGPDLNYINTKNCDTLSVVLQKINESIFNNTVITSSTITTALGYIPENVDNKTSLITGYSETLYPNEKAIHNALDTKLNISDLPTNLTLYPTTVVSDIPGYVKMVTDIHDADYNTVAVNVSTPLITTTNQLISQRISNPGVLVGQPGVFNITTFGNIRHLSGSGTASFYFEVYQRSIGGTETLICTSSNSLPVTNSGYSEFSASGVWDDGDFLATDRIVIKSYANRISGGSDPIYQFQFGGVSPVRTILPVPFSVVNAGYEIKTNKQNSLAVDGTGIKYPTVDATNAGLATKLDASAYNDRYKGKYTSLVALETAHPTGNAGDYAQVDTGAGSDVINYSYDVEDGWIEGGSGSGANDTDALPEGATNLYFTTARVLATLLTGLSLVTGGTIVSTDSVLVALGKLQNQINDLISDISGKANDADVVHLTGDETIDGLKVFLNTASFNTDILIKNGSNPNYKRITSYPGALRIIDDVDSLFYLQLTNSIISFGVGTRQINLSNSLLTATRTYNYPNASGTIALLSSPSFTGTPTAPTAASGNNTNQVATTAFVQTIARPYKVYTALLSQSGTNAPTAVVLENTLGGTVLWSRATGGVYYATLTGAFASDKTAIFVTNRLSNDLLRSYRGDANIVYLESSNGDGNLLNNTIEIRVYN